MLKKGKLPYLVCVHDSLAQSHAKERWVFPTRECQEIEHRLYHELVEQHAGLQQISPSRWRNQECRFPVLSLSFTVHCLNQWLGENMSIWLCTNLCRDMLVIWHALGKKKQKSLILQCPTLQEAWQTWTTANLCHRILQGEEQKANSWPDQSFQISVTRSSSYRLFW